MIALDTNVLVRLLTNDEPKQAQKAHKMLDATLSEGQQVWVSVIVLCELVWVLQGLYGYTKFEVTTGLNALLKFAGISLNYPLLVRQAVDELQTHNADFADILLGLIAQQDGAQYVLTFDKKAAKLVTHRLLT